MLLTAMGGDPYISLYDKDFKDRVILRTFPDGDAGVAVNAGGAGITLGASKRKHQGYVIAVDDKETLRALLSSEGGKGVGGGADALLVLYDEDGNPAWSAP